jgi:ketopantoate reductase
MLQDVEGGRPTEIDGICGAVLEYAEDGEDFPATRTIYQLIKGIDTMPQAEE